MGFDLAEIRKGMSHDFLLLQPVFNESQRLTVSFLFYKPIELNNQVQKLENPLEEHRLTAETRQASLIHFGQMNMNRFLQPLILKL